MKLIKPSFEILEQPPGITGVLKHIETIGRICYKSEEKITEDSYIEFVQTLKNNKHGAMLEHGTVYLKTTQGLKLLEFNQKYLLNRYSEIKTNDNDVYITTNYRVIWENGWEEDLQKYWCEPTEYHKKRISVKFVCDRGVSHEFVRNRGSKGNAFAQESTRYCNYSQEKFGGNITYIIPPWCEIEAGTFLIDGLGNYTMNGVDLGITSMNFWLSSLLEAEKKYFALLRYNWLPQQARAVLPNSLKTELIMTCYDFDWKHFLSLRADKAAHPQAQELAYPLKKEFERRKLL